MQGLGPAVAPALLQGRRSGGQHLGERVHRLVVFGQVPAGDGDQLARRSIGRGRGLCELARRGLVVQGRLVGRNHLARCGHLARSGHLAGRGHRVGYLRNAGYTVGNRLGRRGREVRRLTHGLARGQVIGQDLGRRAKMRAERAVQRAACQRWLDGIYRIAIAVVRVAHSGSKSIKGTGTF